MTAIPTGTIIWLALRPLIRLLICLFSGFIITKCSLFPASASKTIGQMIINVCFPCLLFAKVVPALNPENVQFIGPLVLIMLSYHGIGIAMAWVIKQFCWVPHRFRYGFLAAGAWSNIGDIPTAVLLSLTSVPPFNGSTDPDLAIAYLSVFIVVFNITLFTCGGHKMVAMDYTGPDIDIEIDKQLMQRKRKNMFRTLRHYVFIPFHQLPGRARTSSIHTLDPEQPPDKNIEFVLDQNVKPTLVLSTDPEIIEVPNVYPPSPTVIDPTSPRLDLFHDKPIEEENDVTLSHHVPSPPPSPTSRKKQLLKAFYSILSPPSIAVMISIPISLIVPLKSLFLIPQQPTHFTMPNLPDGEPPLAFILDAAQFIGVAAVPLGLICLGGALARLRLPKPTSTSTTTSRSFFSLSPSFTNLPLGAITLLSLSKLVFLPIFGILIVKSFIAHGIIPKDDKVLALVCMFCACLPTATAQVYLTQIYSGTENTEWLAAFLVPQYVLMVPMMTVYIGLVLKILFG